MAENFENFLHLSKATECSVQGDFWATIASLSPKCQEFHFILPATQGGRSCYCHPCSIDGKNIYIYIALSYTTNNYTINKDRGRI